MEQKTPQLGEIQDAGTFGGSLTHAPGCVSSRHFTPALWISQRCWVSSRQGHRAGVPLPASSRLCAGTAACC